MNLCTAIGLADLVFVAGMQSYTSNSPTGCKVNSRAEYKVSCRTRYKLNRRKVNGHTGCKVKKTYWM